LKGLVGGPLLVGGLGPWAPSPLNPALRVLLSSYSWSVWHWKHTEISLVFIFCDIRT